MKNQISLHKTGYATMFYLDKGVLKLSDNKGRNYNVIFFHLPFGVYFFPAFISYYQIIRTLYILSQ